ncbi:MAG: VIT1/CCC1 transporter family protein [Anaerolineae bacterium]
MSDDMSQSQKVEQIAQREEHFMASDVVRDIVIGMSDGLTVPFAIAAGMSGASASALIVVTAGLAEIAAGSISMGLGGYLAGRTDMEHYDTEREREVQETHDVPDQEAQEVTTILKDLGLNEEESQPIVKALRRDREKWVDFMMRFELGLERPSPRRALQSALTIGGAYAVSGFIPLGPYILLNSVTTALYVSVGVTLLALFVFGYIKGRVTGINGLRSGLQTVLVGGVAAGAAFGIARLIG